MAVPFTWSIPTPVALARYGTTNRGEHFLVMEFIDRDSELSRFVTRDASRLRPIAEKIELLAQAAEGLAALHSVGFIHHDINPRNFLVNREQHVKLIDFGLSVPNQTGEPAADPATVLERCSTWRLSCCAVRRSTSGSTSSPSA